LGKTQVIYGHYIYSCLSGQEEQCINLSPSD
jgi:hypothetical protein